MTDQKPATLEELQTRVGVLEEKLKKVETAVKLAAEVAMLTRRAMGMIVKNLKIDGKPGD